MAPLSKISSRSKRTNRHQQITIKRAIRSNYQNIKCISYIIFMERTVKNSCLNIRVMVNDLRNCQMGVFIHEMQQICFRSLRLNAWRNWSQIFIFPFSQQNLNGYSSDIPPLDPILKGITSGPDKTGPVPVKVQEMFQLLRLLHALSLGMGTSYPPWGVR